METPTFHDAIDSRGLRYNTRFLLLQSGIACDPFLNAFDGSPSDAHPFFTFLLTSTYHRKQTRQRQYKTSGFRVIPLSFCDIHA